MEKSSLFQAFSKKYLVKLGMTVNGPIVAHEWNSEKDLGQVA